MKKILYVVLEQWADWELAYISSAVNMLGNGKFENKTVSLTKDAVTSIGGVKCLPDYDLQSVPSDYDALILIGGMSWHNKNAMLIKPLIDDCIKNGKVLGAICDACRFLGSVGALNGAKHTANDLNELNIRLLPTNRALFTGRLYRTKTLLRQTERQRLSLLGKF